MREGMLPTSVKQAEPSFGSPQLVRGRRHLERVLGEYVAHYGDHRPHRALGLRAPASEQDRLTAPQLCRGRIARRPILGGLINEYVVAA